MARNTLILYGTRILQMIFPLILLPYLTRLFSKTEFGYIVTVQALGILSSAIIEYGFSYTGARDLAKAIDERDKFSQIFCGITSSKFLLSLLSLIPIFFLAVKNNSIVEFSIYAFAFALAQGFSPYWAYQSVNNILPFAFVELLSRVIVFFSVISMPKSYLSVSLFLLISSIIPLFGSIILNFNFVYIENIKFRLRNPIVYIKSGFYMFIFRIGAIAYSSGSIAVLGAVMPASSVGIYGGADKFFRATASLTGPLGEAIFPRVSYLMKESPERAIRIQRLGFILLTSLSIFLALVLFISSDTIIHIFLGAGYSDSVSILKILSLDVFLIGIGTSIGVLYIIPNNLDYIFATSTVIAGVWNILSILILVPLIGIFWMGWTVVISEVVLILVSLSMIYWKIGGRK